MPPAQIQHLGLDVLGSSAEVAATLIQRFWWTMLKAYREQIRNQDYLPQVSESLAARHKQLHVLAQLEQVGEFEYSPAVTLKSGDQALCKIKTQPQLLYGFVEWHLLIDNAEICSPAGEKQDIVVQL